MIYDFTYGKTPPTIEGVVQQAFMTLTAGMQWDNSDAAPKMYLVLEENQQVYTLDGRLGARVDCGEHVRIWQGQSEKSLPGYDNPLPIRVLEILDQTGAVKFIYLAQQNLFDKT